MEEARAVSPIRRRSMRTVLLWIVIALPAPAAAGAEVHGRVVIGAFIAFDEAPQTIGVAVDLDYRQVRSKHAAAKSRDLQRCAQRNHLTGPDAQLACAVALVSAGVSYCRIMDILALRGSYKRLRIYTRIHKTSYSQLCVDRSDADFSCNRHQPLSLKKIDVHILGPNDLPTYLHKPVLPTS